MHCETPAVISRPIVSNAPESGAVERRRLVLPLEISPATVIIGLVIAVLAVLAVRRLVRRGTCDCHDHGGGPAKGGCAAGGCAGCTGCGVADALVADIERAAKQGSAR